jgi:eukaryotic-like serine/threonine-protein kinase
MPRADRLRRIPGLKSTPSNEENMTTYARAGRYELVEELGRGAMGVVYRAHDPVIGRAVAVKTMRLAEQGSGLSHAELLSRFQTEARAAGRLNHPNIVVVHDAGEEDGLFYIIMELVEGRSLEAQMLARQAFPVPRVVRLMQQACAALEFAHQHNVVHRDIKPANLMLTPDDTLKITDFGTAKIVAIGNERTVQIIGTPSYMSPEQIKGRAVDGRSDIFSLGVVLYELVTGEKPFSGENVTTVIYKIVNEEPIPPRELDSSIHPGLSAVIERALAKSPSFRFQSCGEFFEALRNYNAFPDAATGASGAAAQSPARSGNPPTRPSRSLPASRPAGVFRSGPRHRAPLWLALLLLAVIAGAGYRLWPSVRQIWEHQQASPVALQTSRPAAHATDVSAPAAPASDTNSREPASVLPPTPPARPVSRR